MGCSNIPFFVLDSRKNFHMMRWYQNSINHSWRNIMTGSSSSSSQHSWFQALLLHVLPGLLVSLGFILLGPLMLRRGCPPLLGFLLAVLLLDLPFMLGFLFYQGKKKNGSFSLQGVVFFGEKLSLRKFFIYFIGAFLVIYLLMMLVTPLNSFLAEKLFSWLPDWMFLEDQAQYMQFGKALLLFVFTLQLVLTGIFLPWVEELYFRGYLLPRMSHYGKWTPWISGLFFALYHLWQPFGFFSVFVLGTALSGLVLWKRDLRLSIWLHVLANVFSRLAYLAVVFSM